MNNIEIILNLILRKKHLFIEYLQQTEGLLQADEDATDNYITKRDNLAIEIDTISDEIEKILESEEENVLKNIILCKCDYENVPQAAKELYEESRQTVSIMSQIKEINTQIEQELTSKREQVLKRLKEIKNTPQIAKYLGALGNTPNEGSYTGADKKA